MSSNVGGWLLEEVWTPQIELSPSSKGDKPNVPLIPDPYLPVQSQDKEDPTIQVVIPKGRFVALGNQLAINAGTNYNKGLLDTGYETLTLHDGKNLKPVGMVIQNVKKRFGNHMHDGAMHTFKKNFLAGVPYQVAVNEAHGVLRSGDFLTGYWGSTTSSTLFSYANRGRPVKWLPIGTYSTTVSSASASIELPEAVYPGIQPTVVAGYVTSGTPVTGTVTYSFPDGTWVATFGSAVSHVIYTHGQTQEQIAGQTMRVQSLSDMATENPLERFVEDADRMNGFPPQQAVRREPVTAVTNETPTTVTAGRTYRVQNYPMSMHHTVSLQITGSVVSVVDGTSTTYSDWETLSSNYEGQLKNFYGELFTINAQTGLIEIAANVTVGAIRISYSYITDSRTGGYTWGAGIGDLTDGLNVTAGQQVSGTTVVPSNPAGIPAELNVAGVVGRLSVWVK